MRCGFLNTLKPGQGATLQAVRAAIAESGLPRVSLSPDAHLAGDLDLDGLDGVDLGNNPWVGPFRRRARAEERALCTLRDLVDLVHARRPLRVRLLHGLLDGSVLAATWLPGGARAPLPIPAAVHAALLALFHLILPRGTAT